MKHNNAILTETKNAVVASDVATRTDLIKNKKTEIEKTSLLMNVITDNKINLNRSKRK